jgi:dihydroorotate dehydrogenase electron transfer subunit
MLTQEKILVNQAMGPLDNGQGLYKITFHGQIAEQAKPGQFVAVKTSGTNDPLLRRPISIAGIDKKTGETTLYYRVKGQGTALMSHLQAGTYLDVLGPLGNGFSLSHPERQMPTEVILVAGGIGIFSLYSLLEYLLQSSLFREVPVRVLWGGLDKAFLECASTDLLYQLPKDSIVFCTMDGSLGHKGLVTEPLEQHLSAGQTPRPLVAACGPRVMLQAVAELCDKLGVHSEVCMEEHMACGLGACLGCSCQVKDSTGQIARSRVCCDGPVYFGKEVVWNDRA